MSISVITPPPDGPRACFSCGEPSNIVIPSKRGLISVSFCPSCLSDLRSLTAAPTAPTTAAWAAGCRAGFGIAAEAAGLDLTESRFWQSQVVAALQSAIDGGPP